MRLSRQCIAGAILAASLPSAAIADVYRCTEGGKTVYSAVGDMATACASSIQALMDEPVPSSDQRKF